VKEENYKASDRNWTVSLLGSIGYNCPRNDNLVKIMGGVGSKAKSRE
jgi:hypothetical protein